MNTNNKLKQRTAILRNQLDEEPKKVDVLRYLMSSFSENHWCASWLIDLEYSLWKMIMEDEEIEDDDGWLPINKSELVQIAQMALSLDSWCAWPDKTYSLEEWSVVYEEWKNRSLKND